MLEVIDVEGANVIGVKVSGKIQKSEMLETIEVVKESMDAVDTINIYAEIDDFEGFEVSAFLHDMRATLPNAFRFRKEALVTNQQSLNKWVRLSNMLWLGGEARVFTPEQKEAAIEWIQHNGA